MENIIVRGLDESHCVYGYKLRPRTENSTTLQRRSQVMTELLTSGAMGSFSSGLLARTDGVSDFTRLSFILYHTFLFPIPMISLTWFY